MNSRRKQEIIDAIHRGVPRDDIVRYYHVSSATLAAIRKEIGIPGSRGPKANPNIGQTLLRSAADKHRIVNAQRMVSEHTRDEFIASISRQTHWNSAKIRVIVEAYELFLVGR